VANSSSAAGHGRPIAKPIIPRWGLKFGATRNERCTAAASSTGLSDAPPLTPALIWYSSPSHFGKTRGLCCSKLCLEAVGYALRLTAVNLRTARPAPGSLYDGSRSPTQTRAHVWIQGQRRFWDPRPSQPGARHAAGRDAPTKSGVKPSEIECLLHTSVCRDFMDPLQRTLATKRWNWPDDAAVSIFQNACLGFINGMVTLGK